MRALINLSAERTAEPVRVKNKIARLNGLPVVREPGFVDSIVVHQTACLFGAKRGQPRYRRALDVAAHCVAFSTGEVVLAAPLLWHVNHGNSLNARSLGLEIEGRFPGHPGKTVRGFDSVLSEEGLWSAREGLRLLVEGGRAIGMPIKYIFAHRQSSSTRRADPGFEIWNKVVLQYAVKELDLRTNNSAVFGSGRQIPRAWDLESDFGY